MKLLRSLTALAAFVALATAPVPAAAQAARTGPTFRIGGSTSPVILPDVAYDPLHDRYLVVQGNGFVEGQLLDANGNRLNAFPVAMGFLVGGHSQTPRVAFSPDLNGGQGGYLVTWHESVGSIAQVRGKLLSHDGGPLSGDIVIALEAGAPGTGSHWTMGAAVAYSSASREFLVTWMGAYPSTQDIRFTRVNTAGTVLHMPVSITGGADWERDPSVAYNPHQNEFYITYAGYLDAGSFGYVNGQRIQAGTGNLIGGPVTFNRAVATLIPHVEYNPTTQQYVVVWWNSSAFYGVTVNGATGAVVAGPRVVSTRYFAYDALDFAYNAGSGDFLLVTHGGGSQHYEDAAIPINADGSPYDNGFILTNTPDVRPVVAGDGNFNPRVVSSAARGRYLTVTSSKFVAIHGQFATSSANGGGPTPPPPTPRAVSQPHMSLDVPSHGQPVSGNFAVSGWALDLGAASGTGVDTVHVWAQSASTGEWIWLGAANMGVSRPDVAAVFGSANFATSGFGMMATLAPGTYDVNVFAHSLVSGTFNNVQTKRVTVVAPPSRPLMFIDLPVPEFATTHGTLFSISGWAVDLSSSFGSGIEAIHVWAYPTSGAAPIFVGATTPGGHRPDVAGVFGGQFAPSGYSLQGSLPAGDYNLVVFALSSVARNFNNAAGVHMRVF
jgi:hypothetical protein